MNIYTIRWFFFILNSLAILAIGMMFLLSFIFPPQGPVYIIFASCGLIFIGILFVIVHFLERKSEDHQYALSALHRFLSITIKVILVVLTILSIALSLVFFFIRSDAKYLLNSGCLIAFLMICILIELFIRIILPLAGVDHHAS